MLLFRSEEHVGRWCRQWHFEVGAVLSLNSARALAAAWYSSDRRDPNWRRKTQAETREAFRALGLTSPFWDVDS